jgi:putative tricarboxylic transport membrane protein
LRNAVSIGEGSPLVFLQRPMSVAMIVVILGVIALPPLARFVARRRPAPAKG